MTPTASNPKARTGLTAPLVEQGVFMLLASLILDGGIIASAVGYLSIAFWIGAITIWARRSKLTQSDRLYLQWGLPVILLLGVPLFFFVWVKKGVI
jgi:hypothetical protein